MPDYFSGCSTGCQSSIEWHTRSRHWHSRQCPPQCQHTWMTWSRQLFQFVLCSHPTPRCWTSQERELSSRVGLFWSRLCTIGTHYDPTLDPAILWTPSNDTSRTICADSLNLMLPVLLLYLWTLWCYTNAVIIIIICCSVVNSGICWLSRRWCAVINFVFWCLIICIQ